MSVYEASNNSVPAFSVYLQSETQLQRAGTQWQRYLEVQGGSVAASFMCGSAGMSNRVKQIGASLGIGLAMAVGAHLFLWATERGAACIFGEQETTPTWLRVLKVFISLTLTIYDEVGATSCTSWLSPATRGCCSDSACCCVEQP